MAKRSVLLPVLVLLSLSVTLLSHAELLSDRRTMPASARLIDASWNHVFAMAFDGQTMWVSTPLGLKRYDVASLAFQRYPLDKDLLVSSVRDIAVGSDGAVWFATSAGLGRYQWGGWTIYTTANSSLPSDNVRQVETTPDGAVWLYTDAYTGVTRFDGENWHTYTVENSGLVHNRVSALAVDANGVVWIGTAFSEQLHPGAFLSTGAGVSRFDGTTWTVVTTDDGLATNRISALFADRQGGMWVRTADIIYSFHMGGGVVEKGGRSHFDGNGWSRVDAQPWPLASDAQGRLWGDSWYLGISRLTDGQWEVVLPGVNARMLAFDSRDQIWLLRDNLDLLVYRDGELTSLYEGLAIHPRSVAADPRGGIWVGRDERIQRYDGEKWYKPESVVVKYNSVTASLRAAHIAVTSNGEVWAGSIGLFRWDGDKWETVSEGLVRNCGIPTGGCEIGALFADGDNLWVGHKPGMSGQENEYGQMIWIGGGISHWDGARWTTFTLENAGLPSISITSLAKDTLGRLWVGFGSYGASYFDGSAWARVPFSPDGLGGPLYRGQAWGLHQIVTDPSGAVWFAGTGFVSRFDGAHWQSWYSDSTGCDQNARFLVDLEGQVWLYGRCHGMARYENGRWQPVPFEGSRPCVDGAVVDTKGHFWMLARDSLWKYTPPREVNATYIPYVEQQSMYHSSGDFRAFTVARQTGVFTWTFEASPLQPATDGVTGLCSVEPLSFYDMAVIVRFNANGLIDARDGGIYRAEEIIPYTPGSWYSFRVVVDIPSHRYDAFVTPPDGIEQVIGRGLAFRNEQRGVLHLDHWALWSGIGQHKVRNMRVY